MFNVFEYFERIRKLFTRRDVGIIGIILLLFFATRLVNLDRFPIFSDEGIYIRWSKVAWHDATWRFISLTDGRQPLQTWGTIPFLKMFPDNALFAGRLFSVTTGLSALVGLFTLLLYLFGKRSAIIGSFLYVVTPYFLFYDRIALVDSAVNAGSIWIFLFSILLVRTLRLDVALLFGLIAGMAVLAKSSIRLYLGLAASASFFIFYSERHGGTRGMFRSFKDKLILRRSLATESARRFINFSLLYLLVVFIAFALYNVQRLSPFFHFVAEKNKTFVLTFGELLQNPFSYFFLNIKRIPFYIFSEMGYVLGVLGIIGLFILRKKDKPLFWYLSLWLVLPYILISFVAKVMFPRYVLTLGSLLVVPAAYLLSQIKETRKLVIVWSLIIISVVYFDYTTLFSYKNVPFPPVDRGQYLEGWTAGWGARDIMEFARARSLEKPVRIVAEGNFGMSHDVLDVFKREGDDISIQGYWPLNREHLLENQSYLKTHFVYVVFSHRREFPDDWPIELVKRYDKPGGESTIYFFSLTNQ